MINDEDILKTVNKMFLQDYLPYGDYDVEGLEEIDGRFVAITKDSNVILLFPPIDITNEDG